MSHTLKPGINVCIDATSVGYDEKEQEYEIVITNATLLSLDLKSKRIRIKIDSNKLKSIQEEHNDDNKTIENNTFHNITDAIDDDEASDATDQEQEDDEVENIANDDIKSAENTPIPLQEEREEKENNLISPLQKHIDNVSISDHTQEDFSDSFIPKDQQEIIELSDEDDDDHKKAYNNTNNDTINHINEAQTNTDQHNKELIANGALIMPHITTENDVDTQAIDTKKPITSTTPIAVPDKTDNNHTQTDEYASDDDNDRFQDHEDDNERSIKIEHNLRDPYLDEILTKQINAALQIECEDDAESNASKTSHNKPNTKNKNDWRYALDPENITNEWMKHAPTINLQNISTMTKSLKNITTSSLSYVVTTAMSHINNTTQRCTFDIAECECVHRLIFIMKHYSFWMKFKSETKYDIASKYAQSVSDLIDSLKAYNRSKLLRDYLHIQHYHFNDDKLIAYIHRSQIPDCNDNHKMCTCITRNDQNKEIYKYMKHKERRELYWIQDEEGIKAESNAEMLEINLQNRLDVIHSSFLHNAISNGTKFVTKLYIDEAARKAQQENSSSSLMKAQIVDAPHYEFGIKFDFHNKTNKHTQICSPKYPNLKVELLNNPIHKLSRNDFSLIYIEATEYMECDEGCKAMRSRRRAFRIIAGTKISIQHVIVLLTRCNYSDIAHKFDMNHWMSRHRKDNNRQEILETNQDIAQWNKLLIETIVCFGEKLDETQYIYHGINCKVTFRDLHGLQFNTAISCTSQYSVARHFAHEYNDGICLKLGRMPLSKDRNYMFDISDFSLYPNEREVLLYGDKLHFVDIVYDSLSHHDYVLSLQLYQQIIRGRFFAVSHAYDYHNKKHQRRIVKMIENMMNKNVDKINKTDNEEMVRIDLDLGLNYIDPYIQALFESITKSVLKKTIWINKESDTLLPELKSVFINDFIPFLKRKPFLIESRYAHVDTWCITKKHLMMTERGQPLKSSSFDHIEILNNDDMVSTDNDSDNDHEAQSPQEPISLEEFKRKQQMKQQQLLPTDLKITFGFRCYKKYDAVKREDMFKGEFIVTDLPKQIESVKMLGGLWFPQIPLQKWDWCSFSNKKKAKGSSLFPIAQIMDDEELKIKICYQVKEVVQKMSLP